MPAEAAASRVEWHQEPFFFPTGDDSCRPGICGPPPPVVLVKGEPGERNDLLVARDPAGVTIRDAGAALKPGNRCTAEPDGAVRCPAARVAVHAGDGDDRVGGAPDDADGGPGNDVVTASVTVAGGDGDDLLSGGRTLDGGAGADVLTGADGEQILTPGPGADRVAAGPGDDQIVDEPGAPAADVLDAGDGVDILLFTGRRAPVRVDLGPGRQSAGSAGEGNQIAGLELASGGAGDDTLALAFPVAGDAPGRARTYPIPLIALGRGDDRLALATEIRISFEGSSGDDVMSGGEGRDDFDGGAGDDELRGDVGNDVLDGGPGRDRASGGSGRDVVRGGPGADRLAGEGPELDGPGAAAADRIFGDGGNDRISSADTARRRTDRVDCGAGRDSLRADRRDRARRCERVRRLR